MLSDALLERLACPVCGGHPLELVVDEAGDDVTVHGEVGCPDCGRWYHVQDDIPRIMPPDLASSLSASDDDWQPWATAMQRFLAWRREAWGNPEAAAERRESADAMHRRFVEFCGFPEEPSVLLDIGSGTGHIVDLLPDQVKYIGVDPLPAGQSPGGELPVEMPRPERSVELLQAVGEHLPFAEGCFDAVLVMGTLDHSRSPEEILAEAARVLRPGGTLCVLQGLASARGKRGIGAALRSMMRSLSGSQGPDALDTHLHTFELVDEVADLISRHFELLDSTRDAGRAFVRARAPEGTQ